MPHSDFLWITNDQTSFTRKSASASAPASRLVRNNVQVAARHGKQYRKPMASAAKSLIGWNKTKTNLLPSRLVEYLPSPTPGPSDSSHNNDPAESSTPNSTSPVILSPCTMNNTNDPFASTPGALDANVHALIHMYVTLICRQSPPLVPPNAAAAPNALVKTAFSGRLAYYAFLTHAVTYAEYTGTDTFAQRCGPLYLSETLGEIRRCLDGGGGGDGEEEGLLLAIALMAMSAVRRGDVFGARAHLRAAKHLIEVEARGGFGFLQPLEAFYIMFADYNLAVLTLSPPVFEYVLAGREVLETYTGFEDAVLRRLAVEARKEVSKSLPEELVRVVLGITSRYTETEYVLDSGGFEESESAAAAATASRSSSLDLPVTATMTTPTDTIAAIKHDISLTTHLIATLPSSSTSNPTHALTLTLLLYSLLRNFLLMRTGVSKPFCGSLPRFEASVLQRWRVLKRWNALVEGWTSGGEDEGVMVGALIEFVGGLDGEGDGEWDRLGLGRFMRALWVRGRAGWNRDGKG